MIDQPREPVDEPDYLRLNRANWDDRAVLHAEHGGYDLGTYVDVAEHRLTNTRTHEWNHGLAEIITALQRHGMTLTAIEEHDSAPWAFLGDQTVPHPDHPGEFRLRDRPWRLAATYTLQAVKSPS